MSWWKKLKYTYLYELMKETKIHIPVWAGEGTKRHIPVWAGEGTKIHIPVWADERN
jgi:hypothetical protein